MVNVGIIGFGYMGHFHWNKIKQIENVNLIAVFDTSKEKLQEAKAEGLKAYPNLHEFLDVKDMNLVVVCTPNNWHFNSSLEALNAGKNVLCEKPAMMSVGELKEVIECAKLNNKFFTVHQNRRWDIDFKVICDVVKSKTIGDITTIESSVFGERGVCYGWRADPEAGGGMLYDWGVHLIDQMLQLYKEFDVTSVYARILSILTPAVDDFFEIHLNFSNNVCAKVSVGTFALQKVPRWFLFGDRGTLKLDDFSGKNGGMARIKGEVKGFDSVVGKKSLGPSRTMAPLEEKHLETLTLPVFEETPLEFWQNIKESVEGKAKPEVKPEELLRQMKIVEAAFESAKENRVIKTII